MNDFFRQSVFFGVLLTLGIYELGSLLRKKSGLILLNPLLISTLLIIALLSLLRIDYEAYREGAKYITYLLTPATVSLAVPLHEKISLLRKHFAAIMAGLLAGTLTSLGVILLLSLLLRLEYTHYASLLPKSITTAIGMDLSGELGGISNITITLIILTGIFGNITAEIWLKLFGITHPVAKGIGIGCSAHAVGTAKAMDLGEIEEAMSSLSIAITGIMTVILAPVFAGFFPTAP